MLPQFAIDLTVAEIAVMHRTGGSITGSRVAGAFGRIPVEESMRWCSADLLRYGWKIGGRTWAAGAFVDNLFCASSSLGGAIMMQRSLEHRLRQRWRLSIKPESRVAMAVEGHVDGPYLQRVKRRAPEWSLAAEFDCLGHILDRRGSALPDFRAVRRKVIAAMLSNLGTHVVRSLSSKLRVQFSMRLAQGILDYHNSRWPISETLSKAQDALQRRCLLVADGSARRHGEELDAWQRRRSREAGAVARAVGLWSSRQRSRMVSWMQHVEREQPRDTMLYHLWTNENERWRIDRRGAQGSASVLAGRLGARVVTHVFPRWEDSLQLPR